MKKGIVSMLALAATLAVTAASEDTLITFSTQGPDTYLDGSPVLDGECYALVWLQRGATFAGLNADGTLVNPTNNLIVLTAPVAQDGRCPKVAFQVPKATAEACANGTFAVYLLDTRIACGNGTKRLGGVDDAGVARNVNGFGVAQKASVAQKSVTDAARPNAPTTTVTDVSTVPAYAPQPEIKGVKCIGGKVYVTVANTVPYLQYDLSAGTTPAQVDARSAAESPISGSVAEDVILVAPADGSGKFFRVTRHE